jgi:hypothetical protein
MIKKIIIQYAIWAVAFLFIQEVISFWYWNDQDYKDFYYPILNQTGFTILLLNILLTNKMCNFKRFGIVSMVVYYLLGIAAIVFKIEYFITSISYFFLVMSFLLFLISIKKINQCLKKTN